jgi:hypothetical protein
MEQKYAPILLKREELLKNLGRIGTTNKLGLGFKKIYCQIW